MYTARQQHTVRMNDNNVRLRNVNVILRETVSLRERNVLEHNGDAQRSRNTNNRSGDT